VGPQSTRQELLVRFKKPPKYVKGDGATSSADAPEPPF
jgi:hypothetical protein